MSDTIQMPKLPKGASSATLGAWLKAEGDAVAEGDLLASVETERRLIELEASRKGTLARILVPSGQAVTEGMALAEMAASGAKATTTQKSNEGKKAVMSNVNTDKVIPVVMPKAGNDMEEGTLLTWKVQEGDKVSKGDVLFEIETDKATLDVEAEDEGVLQKIVVPEGEMVEVMTPVGYLGDSAEAVDAYIAQHGGAEAEEEEAAEAPAPAQPAAQPAAQPVAAPAPSSSDGRVKASPAARRFAAEKGVDLSSVGAGSGPGGRVLSTDLDKAQPAASPAAAAAAAPMPAAKVPAEAARTTMSNMRKAISRNLVASKQNAPHFYMKLKVEATKLQAFYKQQKALSKISFNDVIVAAVARAMMKHPEFRSQVHGEDIVQFPTSNVGVAVALDDGLRVPVLVGVDQLSLSELGNVSRQAILDSRNGKSVNAGKGTFTISNLGMTEIEEFTAIINPPEAAILAVGRAAEGIKVERGAMRVTKFMTMWLSSDHRVIDGMVAAQFLGTLKGILENPQVLA